MRTPALLSSLRRALLPCLALVATGAATACSDPDSKLLDSVEGVWTAEVRDPRAEGTSGAVLMRDSIVFDGSRYFRRITSDLLANREHTFSDSGTVTAFGNRQRILLRSDFATEIPVVHLSVRGDSLVTIGSPMAEAMGATAQINRYHRPK